MTSKTKNGLIVSGLVLGTIGVVYLIMKNQKSNTTNTSLVDKIFKHMVSINPDLANYQPQYLTSIGNEPLIYLNAWSAAIDNNSPTFTYNGMTWRTSDGIGQ
jgi:hypothetical protein